MTARWTTWLAISLWTISIVLAACVLVLSLANSLPVDGVASLLAIGLVVTIGALLAIHRPGNPIGWIFLIAALSWAVSGISDHYAEYIIETAPNALPEFTLLFWLGAWAWILAFFVPPTFGILLFPTGKLPSHRWRPFAWFIVTWLALMIVAEMFSSGPLQEAGEYSQLTNPLAIQALDGAFDFLLSDFVEVSILLSLFVGSVISIFARLRMATDVERQQIKWFAYAATIPLVGVGVYIVLRALPAVSSQTADDVGGNIVILGIAVLPIAIGIAILRHNLYDIDRLINRTLVYGGLTALLGLGFAGSVVLFQLILSPFTSGNDLAVAGSTLLVAALFRPVRNWLQHFVDRRFYRRKYDAQQTLRTFSVTARDAVDLEQLTGELTAVVAATMQPEHVSVWLRRAAPKERRR